MNENVSSRKVVATVPDDMYKYDTMKIKICKSCKELDNIQNRFGDWTTCPKEETKNGD